VSNKSVHKTGLQWLGLGLFCLALLLFTAMLGLESYTITSDVLPEGSNKYQKAAIAKAAKDLDFTGQTFGSPFEVKSAYHEVFTKAQGALEATFEKSGAPDDLGEWDFKLGDGYFKDQLFPLIRSSSTGPITANPWLWFGLTFGLGILGGLLYILPKFSADPGIKNDHIYHSPLTRGLTLTWRSVFLGFTIIGVLAYGVTYMSGQWVWPAVTAGVAILISVLIFIVQNSAKHTPQRSASPDMASGTLGILGGTYLIVFYLLLYWSPYLITPWVIMVNPLTEFLSGGSASQWSVYGTLYTVIVLVMGVRMWSKYQHNKYQLVRTGSVMFFQTGFAFLIPDLMSRLGGPSVDLKLIWPLDYSFFFDWNLNSLLDSGTFGIFLLGWGVALIVIGVPVLTYFYGKRWYCSWVCGCGGLAETMGDPYRQLSDKSMRAWKYERFIIHGVLVAAIVMTAAVLYHFFTGNAQIWIFNAYDIRKWYGFLIGAGFAGVVGTGFYPLMGNRTWCRFGCPLAAYLGLVQRYKSKFRITTNGSQCISCGNCSTYCEMGIDVRYYAQRGQDIVRSSCVGCGVCSAVCPRGVLRLENGDDTDQFRADETRAIHITADSVGIL
jgi:Pyruvate/2-oxoacid:ferredoxin oxidoreductase delta subunit